MEIPPNTLDGKSFGQWVRRQPEWQKLQEKYDSQGQYLNTYVFRDSLSVQCTRMGIVDAYASEVMGHRPEVHCRSYKTSRQKDVLAAFKIAAA